MTTQPKPNKITPAKQEKWLPYICDDCKEPCEVTMQDFGIGPYEFWGVDSYDHDYALASECCSATYTDREET